ncbi:oocyte zinc finger protein XlCOF7.1-like isoform X2 [Xenopus laevis]|uniref:Oocyte zinc finger protein XlCOF7.1-like isoform X2 n=1 Tax=Xenopus laevis TaxID=8355 RepID=A0A8J1M1U5_XENLA|nr:oocyte zinc finger protein XlCOF7.1-like isoform X2 [Xenopus laevis]
MSNIIQLLTGEEWVRFNKDHSLITEGIKEESQQLQPQDCEYEDKRDITADLGGTLCYNNETSKIGAEGAHFFADGNVEQPPTVSDIKEEPVSLEERNQSDCSINPHTEQIQGTDTTTPIMGCSLKNSLSANYILDNIKEEADTSEISILLCNSASNSVKIEVVSHEEGNQSDCSINPLTEQTQGTDTPTPIMGCRMNNSLSGDIKEEVTLCAEGNQSDCSFNPLTEQIQGTDTAAPVLNNSSSDHIAGAIKEEESDLSDLTIITVSEPTPITGCSLSTDYRTNSKKLRARKHPDEKRNNAASKQTCTDRICEHGVQGKCNNATCYKGFHRKEVNLRQRKNRTGLISIPVPDYRENFDGQQRTHTEDTPHSCSECGKCFKQISSLIVHQKTHSEESKFSCSECGKCFPRLLLLNMHHKSHKRVKPYLCYKCGKCYLQLSDLNAHQCSHRGEKPFPCSVCGKCFTQSSELNLHQKLHSEDKAFTCSECGKCFSRLSSLTVHQISHTGDQPLSCSKCGKCFTYRSQLIVHQRSHIGIKPYSCSECGKGFTQLAHLNAHYRVHQS